jgi:hypothetical protein
MSFSSVLSLKGEWQPFQEALVEAVGMQDVLILDGDIDDTA